MKRICLFVALILLAASPAFAVNDCIEGGPYYSPWACLQSGIFGTSYTLNPTNIHVNIGEIIVPPTVSNLSITNGRAYSWVTNDCTPEQNHYETNAIVYTAGSLTFTPSLPQVLWVAGTNVYTVKVVATAAGNLCAPITNTLGTFTVIVDTNADALLNIDFGAGTNSSKTGYAAIGDATSDYWNHYPAAGQASGLLTNLLTAERLASPVGLMVANLAAAATNNSSDPMYKTFLFTNSTTAATITLTNVPSGSWNVLLYATNGTFEVFSGTTSYGVHTSQDSSPPSSLIWQEGLQFSRFTNVMLASGQNLTIKLWPSNGVAPTISGLQLASSIHKPASVSSLAPSTVIAWGKNNYGQTNVPSGLSNVVAIAGGWHHSLALKSDGTVAGWGQWVDGGTGQPVAVSGVSNAVAIAGGIFNTLILKNDGTVTVLGTNNIANQTNVPAGLSNVVSISAGGLDFLALKDNGTVVGWGDNGCGESSVPAGLSNVVQIAAGSAHSLALKKDGTVVGWGATCWANYGEANIPAGLSNVLSIAAGWGHSMVLKSDGTVLVWGNRAEGETNVPPGLSNVVAIAAGGYSCLALKSDGKVVAWGYNANGQSTVPPGLTNAVGISAGAFHSLALLGVPKPATTDSDYDGVNDLQEIADRTNPNDPNSVSRLRLGYWRFDNTNTWVGDAGQLPLLATNVFGIPSWNTNAVLVETNLGVLKYRDVETNGTANINLRNGSVSFWFKPDWSSTNAGGTGPQGDGVFLEVGARGSTNGWWALAIDAAGTNLFFGTQTNSVLTIRTNLSMLVTWRSNVWHQIVLTYSDTNSSLYLDGLAARTNGTGIGEYPNGEARSHGFTVGTDALGTSHVDGAIDDLDTFNYVLTALEIRNDYQSFTNQDWDNDGVLNWQDANTLDPNIGVLKITIESPPNGSIIN
jgi:hypothetical protein